MIISTTTSLNLTLTRLMAIIYMAMTSVAYSVLLEVISHYYISYEKLSHLGADLYLELIYEYSLTMIRLSDVDRSPTGLNVPYRIHLVILRVTVLFLGLRKHNIMYC